MHELRRRKYTKGASTMTGLEKAFQKENYKEIAFSFNGVGHPTITFKIKTHNVSFLLDTGATSNILDMELAKKAGLQLVATGEKGGGAGGLIHDIYSVGSIELQFRELKFSFDQFFAMDFDTIKQAFKTKGVQGDFHGILGFEFFKKTSCFIDYAGNRIYVKTE